MTGALKFDLGIVGALPNPTLSPPPGKGPGHSSGPPSTFGPYPYYGKGPPAFAADYWLGFDWPDPTFSDSKSEG